MTCPLGSALNLIDPPYPPLKRRELNCSKSPLKGGFKGVLRGIGTLILGTLKHVLSTN